MKEYEQKIYNIINKAKGDVIFQANLAYEDGYKDGRADRPCIDTKEAEDKAYNRGLNEAWNCARKLIHPRLGGYTEETKRVIFGKYVSSDSILQNVTAQEALIRIRAYEDKQTEDEEKETIKERLAEFRATLGCSYGEIYEVMKEMRGAENDE